MSYYQPLSFWEKDANFGKMDVAIIGGGIVGMNAAIRLKEVNHNLKIVIIERSSIGTAASSRNAGFACYGSPSEILSDLETMSDDDVYGLIQKRVKGFALLKEIVGTDKLQYERTGGHEVFIDEDEYQKHLDSLDLINRLVNDIDPDLTIFPSRKNQGITGAAGILSNDWEGQIHPGSMVNALRRKCAGLRIRVLTNLEVSSIEKDNDYIIETSVESIHASKVIICNNAFASDLVDIETEAGRNQVLLTSPIENLPIYGCYHYDCGYVYFRNVGSRVLIGGGRNISLEPEATDQFGSTTEIKMYLKDILDQKILKGIEYTVEHEWSGILGFNKTKQPIVKEILSGKFVAVGLGGMGVAIGTLVGREVADLLLQS